MSRMLQKTVVLLLVLLMAFDMGIFPSTATKAYAKTERKADVVFVIDSTGSMGGVIGNVKNNINQFVDILNEQNINVRLGLVTFKDISYDGYYSTNNAGWFTDTNSFKNRLGSVSAFGGGDEPESDVDGLEEARRMDYQLLSKKFIILVTDTYYKEGTRFDTGSDRITMNREISLLKNDNIVTSVVVPSQYQTTYNSLYSNTNGIFTDISTAFSSNLRALTNMINTNTAPSLSVLSPGPNQLFGQSGTELVPKISVSDADGDALVCNYYLDSEPAPRDSRTISNTATAQNVTFNGLGLDGLSDGSHTLRVEVTDNWADPVIMTINFDMDKSPPIIGDLVATTTDTAMTVMGTAIDSGAGLAATPYRYTIGSISSPWTSDSFTINNLAPNTVYNVNFEAKDNLDHIATKQQAVYTKAQIPTITVVGSTESTLNMKMGDNNTSATQYQIKVGSQYVNTSGSLTTTPTSLTLVNKQITVNGLTANTSYNIQALAINEQGVPTDWSSAVAGTTIAIPPTVTTSRTQTSITVSWPAIGGAVGYDVEADGTIIDNGTATSYTHSNLNPETRHTYRIRVKNAGGISNWSQTLTIFSLPNPPETPIIVETTSKQTEVTITWGLVAKADSYDIETDGNIIELGNQTTYTHTGLNPETEHIYRIRAKNIGGNSTWSQSVSQTTLPYPPVSPTEVKAELSIHSVTVTWDKPERAVAYEIEVDGVIVDNGSDTFYVHEGLEPLSGHTYRVRAKNAGGKSYWSELLNVTTHPEIPNIPTNLMATSDDSSITISWYKVLHTDSYEVEVDGQIAVSGTDSQYVQTGLPSNSLHTYRVRAKNISGYSEWSALVKMSTLPVSDGTSLVSLTNIAAIVTNTNITISWDTVASQAEYEVEVDGTVQDNGKNTIFHHGGLTANEFHNYKIRLKSAGQQLGAWVAVLSLSTLPNPPDSPNGITAFVTDYSIELRWDKVEGASGYDVEIDGKTVGVEGGSIYTDKGLVPGTSHTYRVRAKNITGVTAWSPALVKSTTNPTYTVQAAQDTTFNVSLFAYNVQDFAEKTFVVTYDTTAVDIVDLYDFTPQLETNVSGNIAGTPLYVAVTPGRIEFKVNRNIVPGTSWSGEITTVKFKAKKGGQTTLDVKME